ncbi:MAG: methyl-accepting chemotaxis protein [Pseudomonadota bacterium]
MSRSIASNYSVKTLSVVLISIAAFSGILFSALTLTSMSLMDKAETDWRGYQVINAERTRATSAMIDALGFGGVIHQFKNYVIRRDEGRVETIQMRLGVALGALERLEAIKETPSERAAVAKISSVVTAYQEQLTVAQGLAAEGLSAAEIDRAVKIDDAPALEGIATLQAANRARFGEGGKMAHLSALRQALGFGGMIHHFKNFVLRMDAPRVTKIESSIDAARQALSAYEAMGVSRDEAAALAAIRRVIGAYETKLSTAIELAASGADVEAIDAAVKVNDAPALEGMRALTAAMALDSAAAADRLETDIATSQSIGKLMVGVVAVTSAALAGAIFYVITYGVARPARRMAVDVRRLAEGDLAIDVSDLERDTEIGAIAKAMAVFRDKLQENQRLSEERAAEEARAAHRRALRDDFQTKLQDAVEAALEGDFAHRVPARYKMSDLDSLATQINRLLESVEGGVVEAGRVARDLAQGDLAARMDGFEAGAFGELQTNINDAMARLQQLVGDIQGSANSTAQSAARIEEGARRLSASAESQASSLEETAATMEEMSSSVKSTADNAKEAEAAAQAAAQKAARGSEVVTSAVGAVEKIEESASKISAITSVIEGIAFQTNLLALNAAVEAARAGDAGKGFAVVASEVRTLAQRASEAVKDITALIEESSRHVGEGVDLVRSTGAALADISAAIDTAVGNIEGISTASREQATGVGEVTAAISSIDIVTQQNSSLAEESAQSAQELSREAQSLRQLMTYFSIGAAAGEEANAA